MSAAIVHASAVLIRSRGVLIRGPSGAGKSSLLLSLLHADPADAQLVADDRAVVTRRAEGLSMAPSEELAGLIEVRGQGTSNVLIPPPRRSIWLLISAPRRIAPAFPTPANGRSIFWG